MHDYDRDYRSEYAALAREYAAVSGSNSSGSNNARRQQQELELSRLMAAGGARGSGYFGYVIGAFEYIHNPILHHV